MDKTDPVRVNAANQRYLMHHDPDQIVGYEHPIEFLEHTDRELAAQGPPDHALMGVEFINHQFDFPALVIGTDQIDGRIALRI